MKWNGKNYRPLVPQKIKFQEEKFDVEEYLKSLAEKNDRVPVWKTIPNPIAVNVQAETPIPPPSFDPDYQAILNYATSQGFTLPSASGQTLQNDLLVDLKNANIWSDLDVFYVMATDGDEDFAKLNWKNPSSFSMVENGTILFTTNQGFNPASASISNYFSTQYNPSINGTAYTQDSASRFVWDFNDIAGVLDGVESSAVNVLSNDNTAVQRINQALSSLPSPYNLRGIGFKMIQRTSNTNVNMYNGSSSPTSFAVNSNTIASATQVLWRRGTTGTGTTKLSIYGMGASLSGLETNLYNSINTYMTGL